MRVDLQALHRDTSADPSSRSDEYLLANGIIKAGQEIPPLESIL